MSHRSLPGNRIAFLAADGVENSNTSNHARFCKTRHVVDEEVVVEGNSITSPSPRDPPAFCSSIVDKFAQATTGT